jgi:hypothetical protein
MAAKLGEALKQANVIDDERRGRQAKESKREREFDQDCVIVETQEKKKERKSRPNLMHIFFGNTRKSTVRLCQNKAHLAGTATINS